jgi:hypothetical protein
MTESELEDWRVKCFGWNGEEFHRFYFDQFSEVLKEEHDNSELDKALELWGAGWKSETPLKSQTQIMSWFWRRPGPRGGRLFRSTDQALNALRRERP